MIIITRPINDGWMVQQIIVYNLIKYSQYEFTLALLDHMHILQVLSKLVF